MGPITVPPRLTFIPAVRRHLPTLAPDYRPCRRRSLPNPFRPL